MSDGYATLGYGFHLEETRVMLDRACSESDQLALRKYCIDRWPQKSATNKQRMWTHLSKRYLGFAEGKVVRSPFLSLYDKGEVQEDPTAALWRDATDKLGEACRYLEQICAVSPQDARAQQWLSVLRAPDATCRHLKEARSAPAKPLDGPPTKARAKEGVFELLSKAGTANRTTRTSDGHAPVGDEDHDAPEGDSDVVGQDGCVSYKGRRYQLYRRYAGKPVTFVEEAGNLHFTIEGRMLSKSYPV
jgi:hypothetical protein